MSFTLQDYRSLVTSRLTAMWQSTVKWKAFVSMLAQCVQDLESVLPTISKLDDIDSKDQFGNPLIIGVLLDTLGARVGQSRRISQAIPVLLFGFDDDENALPWSEDDAEGFSGGSWYEEGQSLYADSVMDDATYTIAIKMRILKNKTKIINFETIIESLLFIFPDIPDLGEYALTLTELTCVILLGIGREPTWLEKALFKYSGAFPKPAGIEISGYWWTTGQPVFSFDDDLDSDAAGWFEEGSPSSGGTFSEEF